MSEVIIAAPQAAASMNTMPKPSQRLGAQKQSHQEYQTGYSYFFTGSTQKQRPATPSASDNRR